jgi:DNA-binding GntR family transcriptional regulator
MRQDILAGDIQPGERLMFPEVCERYSTSVGVAREALTALVNQGLVRTVAHLGYSVTPISTTDLTNLGTTRMLIEPLVLRESMRLGGLEWEASVMSAYHVMSRTPHFTDPGHKPVREWAIAHSAFHNALLSGCGNTRLLEITRQLSEEAELYRSWSDVLPLGDRDIAGEHAALLEAAFSGDCEHAAELLRLHIERTVNSILKSLEAGENERE